MKQPQSRRKRAASKDEVLKSIRSYLATNSFSLSQTDLLSTLISKTDKPEELALLAEKNTTIQTCIDIISSIVSGLDLNVFKKNKNNELVPVNGRFHSDHYLSKPNDEDTQSTFLYRITANLLIFGKVYVVAIKNKGQPKFIIFRTTELHEVLDKDGVIVAYKHNNIRTDIPKEKVLVIKKPDYKNCPLSTVKIALQEIVLNDKILQEATSNLQSGMRAKGYLKQENGMGAGLSEHIVDALARKFSEQTSGTKANNTIVVPPGFDYKTIQQTAAEAGLQFLLDNSRKQIVRAFKIPESIYNSEAGATFATANIQEVNFYKNTIKPICQLIEQSLNYWNELTDETEYYKFNIERLESAEEGKLRADTKFVQAQTAMVKKQIALYSPNELRKIAGDEAIMDELGNVNIEADINPFEDEDIFSDPTFEDVVDEEITEDEKSLEGKDALIKKSDVIKEKK